MTETKKQERIQRTKDLIRILKKLYPQARIALKYKTHWQLLVAVQLSAQSTDKKVNEILPEIFKKYKTVKEFASADRQELEEVMSSVLYYKNKAKNIHGAAQKVVNEYGGRLPRTMKEMLTLPGVARKTANVLLGNLFDVQEGIVVDTHMIRFARRFDLSDFKDAVRIERDLMIVVPKKEWQRFPYLVINYGREYGNPRASKASNLHSTDPLLSVYPNAHGYWP